MSLDRENLIRTLLTVPEAGKMTNDYLLPLSLHSTRHMDDIAYLKKKGRIGRLVLTTLDLWEGRGRRHDVFFILKGSLDIAIDNHCSRGQDLYPCP